MPTSEDVRTVEPRPSARRRLLSEQNAYAKQVVVVSTALGCVLVMAILFVLAARL